MPAQATQIYERSYEFAWLGVLARAKPNADMTYSNSDRGFALCSRRSMEISRLYLQVGANEKPEDWPDRRFWDELHARMYDEVRTEIVEGEIFQRDVAHLRAFVISPMQCGRLFLAGDAAHIVPPTGAKGMNLAVADARNLALGLMEFYRAGSREALDRFSERSSPGCCTSSHHTLHSNGNCSSWSSITLRDRGLRRCRLPNSMWECLMRMSEPN